MIKFISEILGLPEASIQFIGVLTTLLISLVGWSWCNYHKASSVFRDTVYNKLEGIYPTTESYLSTAEKDQITQASINPINTAGAKFRHDLPSLCHRSFNKALNQYCETARKIYWDKDVAFKMFKKSMAKPGELGPGDQLRAAVKKLLSFAK
ncbi:MAG: hypothetical protein ABIJ24_01790 [Nitrospinota bacterium]|nr:hypothetical protein [Nitrospinota bacterium]